VQEQNYYGNNTTSTSYNFKTTMRLSSLVEELSAGVVVHDLEKDPPYLSIAANCVATTVGKV
jgi:hypothetical protein